MVTFPLVSNSSPVKIFKRVDLPEPFAPTTPTIAPGGIEKLKSSNRILFSNVFVIFSASITFEPNRWPFGIMICDVDSFSFLSSFNKSR